MEIHSRRQAIRYKLVRLFCNGQAFASAPHVALPLPSVVKTSSKVFRCCPYRKSRFPKIRCHQDVFIPSISVLYACGKQPNLAIFVHEIFCNCVRNLGNSISFCPTKARNAKQRPKAVNNSVLFVRKRNWDYLTRQFVSNEHPFSDAKPRYLPQRRR